MKQHLLHRAIAVFLAISICTPILQKFWVLVDFKLHQVALTETQCVERDAPVNMCHGSCILSDRLAETEMPSPMPARTVEIIDLPPFLEASDSWYTSSQFAIRRGTHIWNLVIWLSSSFTYRIFHPPKA